MKLNADIIFDNLSRWVVMESYGQRTIGLSLKRARFHIGTSREFKSNEIYIARADRLPLDPVLGKGVLLICAGGNPPGIYLTSRCVCFLVKDNTDLFTLSNLVQQVFDKYDEWDAGLQNTMNDTASIQELIELSFPIFENPILVMDASFRYLAYSSVIDARDDLAHYRPDKNGNVTLNELSAYLNRYGTNNMTITGPFQAPLWDIEMFSINLFDGNVYSGSLTIPFVLRQHRQSDSALAQYLAGIVEATFKKRSMHLTSHLSILKDTLHDLLNCMPVDATRLQYLRSSQHKGQYVCIKMKLARRVQKVPTEYICNLIESSFSGSVAFEYESAIVAFIDLATIPCDEKLLAPRLMEITREMNIKSGASYPFTDLSMVRLYYRQACVAFEMGSIIQPDDTYYAFHDYVLRYMISNSIGDFPLEVLLTEGLRQLLDHDSASQVDYVQTLRTYLNNNMSITKTSEDLFLHRSTLLERLKRIERLLQIDLKDPDERLRLIVSLKIIELNTMLASKVNGADPLNSSDRNPEYPDGFLKLESIRKPTQ